MCFDRNINGNRDDKFLECDYLPVQRCVKLTLTPGPPFYNNNKNSLYLSVDQFLTSQVWTILGYDQTQPLL